MLLQPSRSIYIYTASTDRYIVKDAYHYIALKCLYELSNY